MKPDFEKAAKEALEKLYPGKGSDFDVQLAPLLRDAFLAGC